MSDNNPTTTTTIKLLVLSLLLWLLLYQLRLNHSTPMIHAKVPSQHCPTSSPRSRFTTTETPSTSQPSSQAILSESLGRWSFRSLNASADTRSCSGG